MAIVFVMGCLFGADQCLKYRATTTLLCPVMKKLENGSKPCIPLTHVVERKDIWEAIERAFLIGMGRMDEGFGIVFGPSGSAKQ